MVATRDLQLAEETARELRAHGQREHAAALEAILAATTATLAEQSTAADYWTVREAARTTGLSSALIRKWIAAGRLRAVIVAGQTRVRADDLWACVDALPPPPTSGPSTASSAAAQRQRYVEAGLPADKR